MRAMTSPACSLDFWHWSPSRGGGKAAVPCHKGDCAASQCGRCSCRMTPPTSRVFSAASASSHVNHSCFNTYVRFLCNSAVYRSTSRLAPRRYLRLSHGDRREASESIQVRPVDVPLRLVLDRHNMVSQKLGRGQVQGVASTTTDQHPERCHKLVDLDAEPATRTQNRQVEAMM